MSSLLCVWCLYKFVMIHSLKLCCLWSGSAAVADPGGIRGAIHTNPHTQGRLRGSGLPSVHVSVLLEETRVPGDNRQRHGNAGNQTWNCFATRIPCNTFQPAGL